MADGVRVKICGLMRREDALGADRAGADYLGVILSPGFRRSVEPAAAGALLDETSAQNVAVLVDETPDAAEASARALGAAVIQLHGDEDPRVLDELRARGPWKLWKVVRARTLDDVERAVARYRESADGILVEGWREGSVGGAGVRLSLEPEQIRDRIPSDVDFVLAGGLTPDTVGEAVARFRPDVVDVSSGVERSIGEKEPDLLRTFVESARV